MAKKKVDAPLEKIVRQMTPEKDLKSLLKSAESTSKQVGELTGTHREKIAYAVEKKHLHKKAFAIAKGLDKLEPEKLAELLDHLDYYLDVLGLRKRAEDAPRLALEKRDEDDEDDGREHYTNPNVTRANFGAAGGGGSVG